MARLFEPYEIKGMPVKNRLVMAPMCQYSADDRGLPLAWHRLHYATRAVGQVGTIIIEATAVERRGRISDRDLGLWGDEAIDPFRELIAGVKAHDCRCGIQLAHAGRKATIQDEAIVAPSAIAFSDQLPVPVELSTADINRVVVAFAEAARRAVAAGTDFIEIHAAHGYLINQFLSPLTNRRTDAYGQDRALFLRQVLTAVAGQVPEQLPVFLRISAEEYQEGGNHPAELARLLAPLREMIDLIHVSSGGVVENAVVPVYSGYQLAFADTIRQALSLPVLAVGMLETPQLAEEALRHGRADLVALGRELLRNPYWPLQAAKDLGAEITWPTAYVRAKG